MSTIYFKVDWIEEWRLPKTMNAGLAGKPCLRSIFKFQWIEHRRFPRTLLGNLVPSISLESLNCPKCAKYRIGLHAMAIFSLQSPWRSENILSTGLNMPQTMSYDAFCQSSFFHLKTSMLWSHWMAELHTKYMIELFLEYVGIFHLHLHGTPNALGIERRLKNL